MTLLSTILEPLPSLKGSPGFIWLVRSMAPLVGETAAQGLSGINAVMVEMTDCAPFVLDRADAYIGMMMI